MGLYFEGIFVNHELALKLSILGLIVIFLIQNILNLLALFLIKLLRWKRIIAILGPLEIDSGTSSWVNISLRQLMTEIKKYYKRVTRTSKMFIAELYPMIINPYGGSYLETDLEDLPEFNRIKRYVRKGGIFINIADIPFYYAYSKDLGRMVDTTPPSGAFDRSKSFFDTIINKNLFAPVFNSAGQHPSVDRSFSLNGSMINLHDRDYDLNVLDGYFVGPGNKVVEAVSKVKVSPFIAIPYGKGYFVFSTFQITLESLANMKNIILKSLDLLK